MSGLPELVAELRSFVAERDWSQFHDPKNLVMLLVSEVGELAAEFRWINNAAADGHASNAEARTRIAAEIGDIAIALLLLCDRVGIDAIEAARAKLELNRRNYPTRLARGLAERPGKQ